MLFIEVLIKTLLLTKICQSLTIYQPSKRRPNRDKYIKFKSLNSATFSKRIPLQAVVISDIVNKQRGHANIYPAQNHYSNPLAATRPKMISISNEQPVTAVSLESEILHEPKKIPEKSEKPSLFVNYNYTKGASPLTSNKQDVYLEFIARNQTNFKKNHDDKLIERNIEEIKDVNDDDDQQYTTTAAFSSASTKQPSMKSSSPTAMTSHETRYLHDIFLNYPKSHHVNFGHTELSPVLFEKRFESQKAGNRYKGEIMWLDNMGGFAQHYWDLAQGRL